MQYGDYNLRKFTYETYSKLSEKGQEWLIKARDNLQNAVEAQLSTPNGGDIELNDKLFTSFAYGTHADAYWDAGLKDLSIVDLVNIGLTPDIKHLATSDAVGQIEEIGGRLLNYWISNPKEGAKRGAELLLNANKINSMVREYVTEQVLNGGGTFDKVYNETRAILQKFIPKISDIIPAINIE